MLDPPVRGAYDFVVGQAEMAEKGSRILDRFTILDEFETDERWSAYLADDQGGGQALVLEFPIESLESWDTLNRLEKRAEHYAELSHGSLPDFIGYYSDDSSDIPAVYFIHEYVSGESFESVVKSNGPLSAEETEAMLRDLLEGLVTLHQLDPPVNYGDLAPGSIVRNKENRYRFTHLPVSGGPARASSDIQSLGMCCKYALTGKYPDKYASGLPGAFGELGHILDSMTDPDAIRTPSAVELLLLLSKRERMPSHETGGENGTVQESAVEIVSSDVRDTVRVYNPNATRAESLLIGFFLDMWAKRPWIIILIAAALSAGPIAIPLIIFLFHPKSKILLNRAYAKYRDVFLNLGTRSLSVSDQIKDIEYSEIVEHEIHEFPGVSGIQLETVLRMRGGKEKRFYLSSLSRAEARRISGLIDKRILNN